MKDFMISLTITATLLLGALVIFQSKPGPIDPPRSNDTLLIARKLLAEHERADFYKELLREEERRKWAFLEKKPLREESYTEVEVLRLQFEPAWDICDYLIEVNLNSGAISTYLVWFAPEDGSWVDYSNLRLDSDTLFKKIERGLSHKEMEELWEKIRFADFYALGPPASIPFCCMGCSRASLEIAEFSSGSQVNYHQVYRLGTEGTAFGDLVEYLVEISGAEEAKRELSRNAGIKESDQSIH